MANPPKVVAPSTGATVTLAFKDDDLYVNKDTTLDALTVKLPAAPALGETVRITSKSAITALTVKTGAGASISGSPSALVAGGTVVMRWISRTLGWKTSAEDTGLASLGDLGVTSSAAEVNITDGVTATAAELNYNDITTLGTGAASKAVVLDSGDDYTWPATGVLTYGVLKDPAATTLTATAAELNYNDITTLGTGAASKAVVLDSGEDYTWPATGILKTGVMKDVAGTTLGATHAEINNAADVSARTQELTASGAVTAGKQSVELNHATVVIAATIADAVNHQGLFIAKDTSATGTAAHTLTLTAGTFNGTNNVATFNARDECLVVYFDSTGRGTIIVNVGGVALS